MWLLYIVIQTHDKSLIPLSKTLLKSELRKQKQKTRKQYTGTKKMEVK